MVFCVLEVIRENDIIGCRGLRIRAYTDLSRGTGIVKDGNPQQRDDNVMNA